MGKLLLGKAFPSSFADILEGLQFPYKCKVFVLSVSAESMNESIGGFDQVIKPLQFMWS
jgi:hypothetical protein